MVNKHTVLKAVRTNRVWEGYIAPSNVNSFHIKGGWHLGMAVLVSQGRDGGYYVVSQYAETESPLEAYLNEFKHYNCNGELGQRVRFWQD